MTEEGLAAVRWAARGLGAFALGVFGVLVLERGVPRSMLQEDWEVTAQFGALVLVAVGYLLALRWEGFGGWILVCGSVVLGVLASIAYEPRVALFGCLAFFVPGALFLLHWQHHQRRLVSFLVTVGLLAALWGGGIASSRVYEHYYGPTHPDSITPAIPVGLVEWIWAGAVTTDAFTIKAMLADPDDGTPELVVQAADGTGPEYLVQAQAGPTDDSDVVTYRVEGLRPATRYRYEVRIGTHVDSGRRGELTTFPSGPARFTIAFASCARTGSNGQVFDRIRETSPLLYVIPGDIHYENISADDPKRIADALNRVLASPAQQALYLSAPVAYTWDDHDFGGDGSDRTSKSRSAVQAVYREYVPHYGLVADSGAIYQAFSVGRVRFVLTDTRSERSPAGATEDTSRTILGTEQKAWLKLELLQARDASALTVWVNSVPWIAAPEDGSDNWGGYAADRREISDFVVENRIDNVVMLSGDAHMLAIDDGSNNTFGSDGVGPAFPVFHAAALDRRGTVKGGPYSEGAYPGTGHFGVMTATDHGDRVRVEWSGRDYLGREIVRYEFTVGGK